MICVAMPTKTLHARLVLLLAIWTASILTVGTGAFGQVGQRAAFLVNNGNNEGSVTSYLIHEDGSLEFVEKLITGQGPGFDFGTNARAVDITPDGEFLAIGHATGNPPSGEPVRRITIVRVNADATMNIHMDFLTDATPNSVKWIDDEYLVAMRSSFNPGSEVIVYHVDLAEQKVTEVDRQPTGGFSASLALHPSGQYLFVEAGFTVRVFRVNTDRTLTLTNSLDNNLYTLGLNVTPDGERLYGGGGISGDKVGGFDVDSDDGTLVSLPNSPYDSPGDGPRQVVVSSDSTVLAAGHGGDATIHTYLIDTVTGDLTLTGYIFDVGFQANLRDMAVLDELLLVPARGILSNDPEGLATFNFLPDGSLTMRSDFIESQGISPEAVVGWSPAAPDCPADLNNAGVVDGQDLLILLSAWGECEAPKDCPVDLNEDGEVDGADLLLLLGQWGPCPE